MERDRFLAKVWLDPVQLQDGGGFRPSDIARILELVRANETRLLRAWNEYFAD